LKDKLFKYNHLREEKLKVEKDLLTQISQLKNELELYKDNTNNLSRLTKDEEHQQQIQMKKLKQNEDELMNRLKEKDSL
jgi:conjugal transfer/entry exclusion protein